MMWSTLSGAVARKAKICVFALSAFALASCASVETAQNPDDPYEGWNRRVHNFNVTLDRNILRPVAQGYDTVTPGLVQLLVGNFLSHLELPGDFANHVFQGEFDRSLDTFGRFAINTVVGAGGVLDPATDFGLTRDSNDFGVTLGKAGAGSGPFLMLPLLGPTNPRDVGGTIVDLAFSPSFYVGQFTSVEYFGVAQNVVGTIDQRNRNASFIDQALYESPDSYVTLRSVYNQRRAAAIGSDDGEDDLPIIFDDEIDTTPPAQ